MDISYGFGQHVAQQSRRDKLRAPQNLASVQCVEELSRNSEQLTFSHSAQCSRQILLSSEMINFSIDSNVLSDQRDIMLRQELGPAQCSRQILTLEDASFPLSSFSNSLLKGSNEIVNGAYWRTAHQTCDWVVNCASTSLGDDITPGSMLTGEVSGELQLPPALYQNFPQGHQMPSVEDSGNELMLLPVYRDQSNVLPFDNPGSWTDKTLDNCRSWIGELGSMERSKNEQELRTFTSDSNPQGLSLSLSSNPSKLPITQFEESQELSHDPKTVKSENLCRFQKPSTGVPASTYRNTGPLGPFTGYATILKSSKFLKPAQVLLDEFCGLTGSKFVKPCEEVPSDEARVKVNNSVAEVSTFYGSIETSISGAGSITSESHQPEYQQKKAKLLYMLDEVCRRYKQYHQQMQMVVSSFESVAGLSSATPYISLALKTVSRHFRCLKSTISEQLKYLRKVLGEAGTTSINKSDTNSSRPLKFMEQSFQKQKSGLNVNMGLLESQHVWRPQRGLPERAVAILRAWLFDHFLHPYPTDTDKHMLATQTGLSRNQVSNWFINARVRVWKPMVEEIHLLETKGLAEMNKTHHGQTDGNSRIGNTGWTGGDQLLKAQGGNEVAEQNLQCLGADSGSGSRNWLSDHQQWNHDTREFVGFMPYQPDGVEVGGLGAVALTLGLRHHQLRRQEDDQVIRHYGNEMIHDFVG